MNLLISLTRIKTYYYRNKSKIGIVCDRFRIYGKTLEEI